MGGKFSGNRTPSDKKLPKEQKSQLYQFRLDPKKPEQKALKDTLDGYIGEGNRSEVVRDLVAIALHTEGVLEYQQRVVSVAAEDVVTIKDIVTYIMERVQEGLTTASTGKDRRKKKVSPIDLPDAVKGTLDHYIGGGLIETDEAEDPFN